MKPQRTGSRDDGEDEGVGEGGGFSAERNERRLTGDIDRPGVIGGGHLWEERSSGSTADISRCSSANRVPPFPHIESPLFRPFRSREARGDAEKTNRFREVRSTRRSTLARSLPELPREPHRSANAKRRIMAVRWSGSLWLADVSE